MSEWIEWNGGECPVDGNLYVDVKLRSGKFFTEIFLADDFYWNHDGNNYDIIAYRIHKSLDDATPEEWDKASLAMTQKQTYDTQKGYDDTQKRYDDLQKEGVQSLIETTCDNIKQLLLAKNEKYGNSALQPKRIFSKASNIEQLLVRIDDKLSRIETTGLQGADEDTLEDLIGYLILLKVAKNEK